MIATESDIFTDETFWEPFYTDLAKAHKSIIISCPFVRQWRLDRLEYQLKTMIRNGISVCIFVQTPASLRKEKGNLSAEEDREICDYERDIKRMSTWKAHVTERPRAHQKFAIIDGTKLWEGSLNILSHRDGAEHMRRFDSRYEADRVTKLHELDRCFDCEVLRAKYFVAAPNVELQRQMIAHAIHSHRKYQKFSLRELSAASGVAHQRISQIENAKYLRAIDPLFEIFNALGLRLIVAQADDVSAVLNQIEMRSEAR
jgi:hypothetical protein